MIEQVLALFLAAYGRDPLSGMEKRIKVAAWRTALEDVPRGELLPLAQAELKARTSPFLPVPADLLRRWKGEDYLTNEDGKTERVTVANASAYQPLQPTANQLAFNERALPEPEGTGRALWQGFGARHTKRRLAEKAERQTPRTPEQVLDALFFWCEMQTWSKPREVVLSFGRWLLERFVVAEWTPDLGREQWHVWQQEQVKERAE